MDKNQLIDILSYFDSIHDFGKFCNKNTNYCTLLRNYYNYQTKDYNDKIIKIYNKYKKYSFTTIDSHVDDLYYDILSLLEENSLIEKIDLHKMIDQIVKNFRIIFSKITNVDDLLNILDYNNFNSDFFYNLKNLKDDQNTLNLFYSNDHVKNMIFYQRYHIYQLIVNKNKINIRNEIIKYFLQNTYDKYKDGVTENLNTNTFTNIMFPITVIDDMSSDKFYLGNIFKFKIFNNDKDKLDGAKTANINSLLSNKSTQNNELTMIVKYDNNIGIGYVDTINNNSPITIDIFNFRHLINKKNELECYNFKEIRIFDLIFNKNSLRIIINNNTIGSPASKNGIYPLIIKVNNILDSLHNNFYEILTKYQLSTVKDDTLNILVKDFINTQNKTIDIYLQTIIYILVKKFAKTDIIDQTILNQYIVEIKKVTIFILVGFKRFGDWSQMIICKNNYFYLQTKDKLCKLFGILYGAPVIDKKYDKPYYLYNYTLSQTSNLDYGTYYLTNGAQEKQQFEYKNRSKFGLVHKKLDSNMNTYLHSSNLTNKISSYNRYYFYKYLKYKRKYYKLKVTEFNNS